MQETQMRWIGHLMRTKDNRWSKLCTERWPMKRKKTEEVNLQDAIDPLKK